MTRTRIIVSLVLIALAILGLCLGFDALDPKTSSLPWLKSAPAQQADRQTASVSPSASHDDLVKQLAIHFLEEYGETIDQPATQARLYGEWQKLLMTYPERGQWLFEAALALAFPDLKDNILSLLRRLARYNQWLEDNELALRDMGPLESQAAIWQKRHELFGDDAPLIWAEEQTAMYRKQEAMQKELQRLDQAFDISPSEAAYQLQAAVEDIYGDGLGRRLITADVLAAALFSLDSVQAQLQALPEAERQSQVNALRRQLGYPDALIKQLEEQDRQREESWQKGYRYMAERDQLSRQFSGDQLEQELEQLRRKYFGIAAVTIAREEAEGFFRFNRPRRLGLN